MSERSKIAAGYFLQVSDTYPASVPHQAAYIALRCQEENQKPFALRRALLRDKQWLRYIANAAEKRHKPHEKAPQSVPPSEVKRIARETFRLAANLNQVPSGTLRKFLTSYQKGEGPRQVLHATEVVYGLMGSYPPPLTTFLRSVIESNIPRGLPRRK